KKPRADIIPVAAVSTKNVPVATVAPQNIPVAAARIANTIVVPSDHDHHSPNSAEINALNEKMVKMQAEIDGLKKQLAQVVTFIKQKIK
ncbi:response regulator, partial [Nodularia sphaerocarpa CS-585A2]|nr:response regulator [Nodularia sphaerocarpa CS-585A2]